MLSVLLPSSAKSKNAVSFTSIQCQERECFEFYFHPVPRERMLSVLFPSSAKSKNADSFTSIQCQECCQFYFHPVPRVRILSVLLPSSAKRKNAVRFTFIPTHVFTTCTGTTLVLKANSFFLWAVTCVGLLCLLLFICNCTEWTSRSWPEPSLTFKSLAITLRTTRFNIQKFCMVLTLGVCVWYGLTTNRDFCLTQP